MMAAPDRLNVLFMTAWYPSAASAVAGIFVREHARAVQIYDDVQVIHCIGKDADLRSLWTLDKVTDSAITLGIPTYQFRHRALPVPGVSSLLYVWGAMRAVDQIMAGGFRPDVIHVHIYEPGVPAVLIGKKYGIPVVITEQNSDFPRNRLPWLQIQKARFAFRRANRILPVSSALQQAIQSLDIDGEYTIVPNVVETELFAPPGQPRLHDGALHLLFVGGLTPVKGLPFLFEALGMVSEQRTDWHLDLVGDGANRGEYEAMVQRLGLGERVTFHGMKSKAEVADFMRGADLFVLPSVWDNMPCVLLEAMSTGLPAIASDIGGIPDTINPLVGRLFPPSDAVGLAKVLVGALDAIDTFDRPAIAEHARRYGFAQVGGQIDAIYREVIG